MNPSKRRLSQIYRKFSNYKTTISRHRNDAPKQNPKNSKRTDANNSMRRIQNTRRPFARTRNPNQQNHANDHEHGQKWKNRMIARNILPNEIEKPTDWKTYRIIISQRAQQTSKDFYTRNENKFLHQKLPTIRNEPKANKTNRIATPPPPSRQEGQLKSEIVRPPGTTLSGKTMRLHTFRQQSEKTHSNSAWVKDVATFKCFSEIIILAEHPLRLFRHHICMLHHPCELFEKTCKIKSNLFIKKEIATKMKPDASETG